MQGAEQVSTLMDGELDADEATREITRLRDDPVRRDAWKTYHLIGESLRGERAEWGLSADFSQRLSARLAGEPTVLAPRARAPRTLQSYAVAAAASVAGVAVVGWAALRMVSPDMAPDTVSKAPAVKPALVVTQALPVAPRVEPVAAPEQHMHEYLLAHQGISPSTAIQGVTPYIRTVSNVDNQPGLR